MRRRAIALTAVVLLATLAPASVGAATGPTTGAAHQQSSSGYAGTHVSYETSESALVDYAVDGDAVADSIRVEAHGNGDAGLSVTADAGLSSSTEIAGSALTVSSSTRTKTTVRAESGATLAVHDNGHGSLVVSAENGSQAVAVNLSEGATATQRSDARVTVETAGGTEGTFLVVGEGNVTASGEGNVTAALSGSDRLVFRAYPDGRTSADATQEELIADGTAAASVHLRSDGGETVADAVTYGSNTTVSVTERSEGRVTMAVERTEHEGRVVMTSLANSSADAAEDVRVTVDGEAAAEASSTAELRQAANGGDRSKYAVSGSGDASADVLVAVNHFSKRSVAVSETESGEETTDASGGEETTDASATDGAGTDESSDDGASTTTDGTGPGVGPIGTLVAAAATLLGLRRRA